MNLRNHSSEILLGTLLVHYSVELLKFVCNVSELKSRVQSEPLSKLKLKTLGPQSEKYPIIAVRGVSLNYWIPFR